MIKEVGMIGLGKMGIGMSERLLNRGIRVVAYNRSRDRVDKIKSKGAIPAYSLEELIANLNSKRKIILIMLPAGKPTNDMIKRVLKLLSNEDILINGANDFYKNAEKQSKLCEKNGVVFFDFGVSGGILGFRNGYVLMIGGKKTKFKEIEFICRALSPKNGYAYFGEAGSGHFVKSVHNIIEYVYLQGIAEGIELLDKKRINLLKAVRIWNNGSIIQSLLIELTANTLKRNDFNKIKPKIESITINELIKTKNSIEGFSPAFDVAVKIRKNKTKDFLLGK
ncbi:MAG: NAD(P)-binding domain-containing protein, partial [Candidatus Pacearchaeota archaeon]